MPPTLFTLLDPSSQRRADPARRAALTERQLPAALGSHRLAAEHYQASPALVAAVNVALAVGAPLLITGEPGTGKTQVAHYVAWYFHLTDALFSLDVRSNTTTEDLLYSFDSVAYFHAAHEPSAGASPLDRTRFVHKGPLWRALETGQPSVVLIDEIDKAPRDFPNDLLGVLDQARFFVREWGAHGLWVERAAGAPPPLCVITSNSERRLPEPFLRRCIFHHIEFTEELLRKAVAARRADFPGLQEAYLEQAVQRLLELRTRSLRKKPATAELLVWLVALAGQGAPELDVPLAQLPALSALVKDRDDLAAL